MFRGPLVLALPYPAPAASSSAACERLCRDERPSIPALCRHGELHLDGIFLPPPPTPTACRRCLSASPPAPTATPASNLSAELWH